LSEDDPKTDKGKGKEVENDEEDDGQTPGVGIGKGKKGGYKGRKKRPIEKVDSPEVTPAPRRKRTKTNDL